jgi:dienelactone hydrolase
VAADQHPTVPIRPGGVGAVVLVLMTALAGCASTVTKGVPRRSPTHAPPSAAPPTTPPVSADGTFSVATTSLQLVEPASVPGGASRSLPTAVWFPGTETNAAPEPDRTHAPYPLLVFSQGYDSSVQAYQTLLEHWASAGFVVAAPTYPHTDPSDPAGLDEADIVNHPTDLRFVISTLLQMAADAGTELSGLINPNEVGLIGHSDGGDVSLAVAESSCCQDPRVKAAAVLSGAELASFGGSYVTASPVPLIVVQGDADTINPPACSAQAYDDARPPKYYLDLLGAGHGPPYLDPGTDQEVVAQVVTDFFDAELAGQPAATAAMMSAGDLAGVAEITDAPLAPSVPGSCPGAPPG